MSAGRVCSQPTITNEFRSQHYEVDGCCGYCGPCFHKVPNNTAASVGPCQGWPCPTVKALEVPRV